jgi:hypothetical protein
MPSGPTIDHHKPIHYVEQETAVLPDKPFEIKRRSEGTGLTATGICPACGGRTATTLSYGIGGSKGFRGLPHPPLAKSPVTIFCECGHAHADRPADALDKGCGRFWLVDLPTELRTP